MGSTAKRLSPSQVCMVAATSESRFQLIDSTDLAGTIPYLAKG